MHFSSLLTQRVGLNGEATISLRGTKGTAIKGFQYGNGNSIEIDEGTRTNISLVFHV